MADTIAIGSLPTGTASTDDYIVFVDNADNTTKKSPISSFPSTATGDMLKANYDPANINQQVVGTTATQTLTNKTLTAPRFADLGFIADQNGNEMLAFNSNASAVNYIELENNVTGSAVHIRAKGDDANVGLHLVAKGSTGYVNITDSTDETKRVRFDPSTNTTGITTTVRTNSTTARTIDLPNFTATLASYATTTEASNATPTPVLSASTHTHTVTALAVNATFGAPTGTPFDGQNLIIRIKDNGTARTLAWNAIYRASSDLALPTTTVISKTMYLGFRYNSSDLKWDLIAFLNNI